MFGLGLVGPFWPLMMALAGLGIVIVLFDSIWRYNHLHMMSLVCFFGCWSIHNEIGDESKIVRKVIGSDVEHLFGCSICYHVRPSEFTPTVSL